MHYKALRQDFEPGPSLFEVDQLLIVLRVQRLTEAILRPSPPEARLVEIARACAAHHKLKSECKEYDG